MFNKLKYNNLVITNKKLIQKGKSQVVQKCVQKIRKIKQLQEKQKDHDKHKNTLRKTLNLMENVKKLKCHNIMKALLLLEKNPTAVMTNARSSIEETSIAMLAMNKILKNLLNKLKTELQLTDGDRRWRRVLQEQSKRRVKIARTEEKKRRRMESKEQKLMSRKREEWLESNTTNTIEVDEIPKEFVETTTGLWKEETITEIDCEPQKADKVVVTKQKRTKQLSQKLPIKAAAQPQSKRIDPPPTISHAPATLVSNIVEVEQADEQVVDPFFITEQGDNYVSTVAAGVKNNESIEHYEPAFKRKNTIVDLQHRQRPERHSFSKLQHSSISAKIGNGAHKIHPSWEAKQRIKPVISKFQGKKTSFTNESVDMMTGGSEGKSTTVAANLHPSWAAKQKLKPVITSFQGKKIVFDTE